MIESDVVDFKSASLIVNVGIGPVRIASRRRFSWTQATRTRGHVHRRTVCCWRKKQLGPRSPATESRGRKPVSTSSFFNAGNSPEHVLESRLIGLIVGNVLDPRGTARSLLHQLRQSFNGDFVIVAYVDDFTDRLVGGNQPQERFHGVAHIAEAARLLSRAVHGDRRILQRLAAQNSAAPCRNGLFAGAPPY